MHLSQPIPALPVASVEAAVPLYVEKLGFAVLHQDDGIAILVRDDAEVHLWESGDGGWRLRPEEDLRETPVRTGAETFLAGTASCRIAVDDAAGVDALYAELAPTGVLHHGDNGAPVDTDHGTREFHTVDLDGNLLTFFTRV